MGATASASSGRDNAQIRRMAGISGGGQRELNVAVRFRLGSAVRAAGAAGLGAGAQRLVDDGLDGTRASSTLGAATEASVNLLGGSGEILRSVHGITDVVIAKHVTGTDNHKTGGPSVMLGHFDIEGRAWMQKEKPAFEAIPNWPRTDWNGSKQAVLIQRNIATAMSVAPTAAIATTISAAAITAGSAGRIGGAGAGSVAAKPAENTRDITA